MKKEFNHDLKDREGHEFWEWKPMAMKNLEYAAIDGYLSYEIFNKIYMVNDGQRHLDDICPQCKKRYVSSSMNKRQKQGWE